MTEIAVEASAGKVVRLVGALQGTTVALSIFDEPRRRALEAVGATLQWVCDAHFDGSPDDAATTDVIPLACQAISRAPTRRPNGPSVTGRQTTTYVGSIECVPSDVFGNEDPMVWSARRNGTAQCIVDVPASTPIVIVSNAPAARIAEARARRERRVRQEGADAENEGEGVCNKPVSSPVQSGDGDASEPSVKVPFVLYTRALLHIPPPTTHNGSLSTFCLGTATTRISNIMDLAAAVAEAKINIIGADLSDAMKHCVEGPSSPGVNPYDEQAANPQQVYNPYKLDVDQMGNLVEPPQARVPVTKRMSFETPSPSRGGESRLGNREYDDMSTGDRTPRETDGGSVNPTTAEDDDEDGEMVVGFAYVSFGFADLGTALAPVVAVEPDTILSDTTAKLLLSQSSDRPVDAESQRQQLAKVATPPKLAYRFALLPSTASMKLGSMNGKTFGETAATAALRWSKSPMSAPYGCMPLVDLYAVLASIYTTLHGGVTAIKTYKPLLKQLEGLDIGCGRDPLTGQYRWELVRQLSLLRFILGEVNILPVLSLLVCLRGLEHVDLDMNCLRVTTAKRLVGCLRSHSRLQSVSLRSNEFYESSGEQLLRLLKSNPRIVVLDLDGNFFSPPLAARIARVLEANGAAFRTDPFNFLSADYNHLSIDIVSLGPGVDGGALFRLIPEAPLRQVLHMWSIIACTPETIALGLYQPNIDVTSKLGNNTATSFSSRPGSPIVAGSKQLGIPTVAMAPLLSSGMRAVQIDFTMEESQDRIISGVFKDFGGIGVAANVISGEEGLLKTDAYPQISFRPSSSNNHNPVARAAQAGMDVAAPNMEATFSRSYSKLLATGLRALLRAVSPITDNEASPVEAGAEVADGLLSWRDSMEALVALGDIHYRMGIRPSHYVAANRHFVKWLGVVFSDDKGAGNDMGGGPLGTLTPACRAAWFMVLALLCRITLSGCPIGQQLL